MSIYNAMFGYHPLAPMLMTALRLDPLKCGRFRDCYLQVDESGEIEIHVHTRNGGGNREAHVAQTAMLQAHPGYRCDYDEAHDTTYATYVFSVPPVIKRAIEAAYARTPEVVPPSPGERFEAAIAELRNSPNSPKSQRMVNAIAPVFAAIDKLLKPDGDT